MKFLQDLNKKYHRGTVSRVNGRLTVFYSNTINHDDLSVVTNADDKFNDVGEYPIMIKRRKMSD